jgi:hypothetical protein
MAFDWSVVLTESFQDLWSGVLSFAPNIIIALIIILLGWFIGILVGHVVNQIIVGVKLDSALKKAGVDDVLKKGEINLDSGAFVGGLVKWFVIIAFLVAAFDVLGLSSITVFLQDIVLEYIPRVIVAALILLFAGVLGDVVAKIVSSSSKAAGFRMVGLLASLSKWSIWIFAILVALQQLGIAVQFISTLFMGTVGALAIALGLAFGLGGKDVAAKIVARAYDDLSK